MSSNVLALTLLAACTVGDAPDHPMPWGADGHEMAAAAAVGVLPGDLPAFFRDAAGQLEYLNPEPDRWRERELREMDEAWSYDHYIDLENVEHIPGALDAEDRFRYLRALYDAGVARPERDGGH